MQLQLPQLVINRRDSVPFLEKISVIKIYSGFKQHFVTGHVWAGCAGLCQGHADASRSRAELIRLWLDGGAEGHHKTVQWPSASCYPTASGKLGQPQAGDRGISSTLCSPEPGGFHQHRSGFWGTSRSWSHSGDQETLSDYRGFISALKRWKIDSLTSQCLEDFKGNNFKKETDMDHFRTTQRPRHRHKLSPSFSTVIKFIKTEKSFQKEDYSVFPFPQTDTIVSLSYGLSCVSLPSPPVLKCIDPFTRPARC